MGKRGPLPEPPELRLLKGDRGHRPLELDKLFRPEVGLPDAPRYLSAEARKSWKRLSVELLRYNLLSKVDRDAFAMLCQTIGRVEQVERGLQAKQAKLKAEGKDETEAFTDRTPNGLRVQSALYQVLNREQAKLHKLLETFGLRPDARASVTAAIRAQLSLIDNEGNVTPLARGEAGQPTSFADF